MNFFNELLTNSHNGDYTNILDVVYKHFSKFKNCEVIIQNISENKSNIIVKWGKPELLINAHLDTVPPANGWITAPYKLAKKDNYYYGLGTCDTKGNIYAISEALKIVEPKNLMLLFSVDEESNSIESGITHFLKSEYAANIKHAIVCEPTNNIVADSHKGYYSFFLKSLAESKHSSESAYLYNNAIYKLGKYFKPIIEAGYNLGTIHGGLAGNIIAPDCCLLISIRSNDEYDLVLKNLNSILDDKIIIESKTILPALKRKLEIKEGNQIGGLDFWTEASLFFEKGIDSVIYGVGDIKQAHSPNEFVSKDSLDKGIEFFINLIKSENEK